jgi:hypothetical protein
MPHVLATLSACKRSVLNLSSGTRLAEKTKNDGWYPACANKPEGARAVALQVDERHVRVAEQRRDGEFLHTVYQ